jgi:hypothetical protein
MRGSVGRKYWQHCRQRAVNRELGTVTEEKDFEDALESGARFVRFDSRRLESTDQAVATCPAYP